MICKGKGAFGRIIAKPRAAPAAPSGPVFTVAPAITGTLKIGQTLSCSTGTATGTGTVTYARQWTRDGAAIGGATGATYTLVDADDLAVIGCTVTATDSVGSTGATASGGGTVTYPAPTFTAQPAFGAGSYAVNDTVTFTLGTASHPATLRVETFTLGGVDKTLELSGETWNTTGESPGTIALQVRATNSGGTVLSSVITVTLNAAATAPSAFTAGQWTLADYPSAGGDTLLLTISALPSNGGSAITALQFAVDSGSGYGSWQTMSGTGTGARQITVLATTAANVKIRAVNAVGNGPDSDVKSATPTVSTAPTFGYLPTRDEGTTGDLYVDAASGNDANPGTFAQPKATISAALAAVTAGQEIKVRAGTYYEGFSFVGKGGSAGNRTTVSAYGTERPVITGAASAPVGTFVACTAADTLLGDKWPNCFKATVPLSTFPHSSPTEAFPFENGVQMRLAASSVPDAQYPMSHAAIGDWYHSATPFTAASPDASAPSGYITNVPLDSYFSDLTDAQVTNCDLSLMTYPNVLVWLTPSSLTWNSGTRSFTWTGTTGPKYENNSHKDAIGLFNCLPRIQKGGWGWQVVGSDVVIYVWPNNPATVNTAIRLTVRDRLCYFGDESHCEIRGLEFRQAASVQANPGSSADQSYAICSNNSNVSRTSIVIDNCLVEDTFRRNRDYSPVLLYSVVAPEIRNLEIRRARGQFGMFINGSSGAGLIMDYKAVDVDNSPLRCYGCRDLVIAWPRFEGCGIAAHANKLNFYIYSHNCLVWGADMTGASGYATLQEASAIHWVQCMMPVSYDTEGAAGYGFRDQNKAPTPAGAETLDGTCYMFNNWLPPYYPALGYTNSLRVGFSGTPEVVYKVHNTIAHGWSSTDFTYVASWTNNLTTTGAIHDASDILSSPSAEYVDHVHGDWTPKAGSNILSMAGKAMTAEIADLTARFPQFTGWNLDMMKQARDWSAPGVGPLADMSASRSFPAIWVDRITITGTPSVGGTLTADDPWFLIGSPYPAITYQWYSSPDAVVWTAIPGATGATYSPTLSDAGDYIGLDMTAGSDTKFRYLHTQITGSYPLGNPTAAQVRFASDGGTQHETPTFTVENRPMVVLVANRLSASADSPQTLTIGAPGRAYGTGTAIPQVGLHRRGTIQITAHYIAAPGTGSVTIQQEGANNTAYVIAAYYVDGATGITAGSNSQGTVAAVNPSTTTTAANSMAIYMAIKSGANTGTGITASGATLLDANKSGALSDDIWVTTAWETAPTAGATATATLTSDVSGTMIGAVFEVLS